MLSQKSIAVRRRVAEFSAERAIRRIPDLSAKIDAYRAASETTGCSYSDYWALYREVRAKRPLFVLELGTGISTVVIATALAHNGFGRVISMEEHAKWRDAAMAAIPEELHDRIRIELSPTVEDGFGVFRGVRYRDIPTCPFDFVFVDGPNYRLENGEYAFDFDFLHVLKTTQTPVSAVIDKRVGTVFVLQQLLGREKVSFDRIRGLGFVKPVTPADLCWMNESPASSAYRLSGPQISTAA